MDIENIVAAFVTLMSLFLMVVSLQSYRRSKRKRILLISVAFMLFFIKGLILSIALFYFIGLGTQVTYLGIFDIMILVMLFAAVTYQK